MQHAEESVQSASVHAPGCAASQVAAAGREAFLAPVRSYGQRKPKLDPVTDPDAPVLAQDVLKLLAGKTARI